MPNRTRDIPIRVWLNEEENRVLKSKAKKTALPISTYIRFLIMGYVPREQLHPDFFKLYRELNDIGNNINQIAARAHFRGYINEQMYRDAAKNLADMTLKIYHSVTHPDRIEK